MDTSSIISDLQWLRNECVKRCLIDAASWAFEIMNQLPNNLKQEHKRRMAENPEQNEFPTWISDCEVGFGWTLIQQREFHRAARHLKMIQNPSPEVEFLYFWARYLACEQNRFQVEAELINRENRDKEHFTDQDLKQILIELQDMKRRQGEGMDVFLLFILGRAQASMYQTTEAAKTFKVVIHKERRFWPAYQELVRCVDSVTEMQEVDSRDHYWMMNMFRAETLVRFQHHRLAVVIYQMLRDRAFGLGVHFINAPLAACKANMQEHESALEEFQRIRDDDPYRIHMMDVYSDSLYVRGNKVKLCQLSQQLSKTHKYTYEVCCILANYYSLRREHDKAISFLQRAIRLNPLASSPWVLVGHEFMEVKNSSAACLAYRKATEIDPCDARGWYGLGQLYDILKMNSYSLEYYKIAHRCKPDDSRMLVALGSVYESMLNTAEAKKTYTKAYKVGDIEGTALIHLAQVCERRNELEHAAMAYEMYVVEYAEVDHVESMCACLKFLAQYYIDQKNLTRAKQYAAKCLEYEQISDEGKDLIKKIDSLLNEDPNEKSAERSLEPGPSQQRRIRFDGTSSSEVLRNRNAADVEMQEDRDELVPMDDNMDESAAENNPGEGGPDLGGGEEQE